MLGKATEDLERHFQVIQDFPPYHDSKDEFLSGNSQLKLVEGLLGCEEYC